MEAEDGPGSCQLSIRLVRLANMRFGSLKRWRTQHAAIAARLGWRKMSAPGHQACQPCRSTCRNYVTHPHPTVPESGRFHARSASSVGGAHRNFRMALNRTMMAQPTCAVSQTGSAQVNAVTMPNSASSYRVWALSAFYAFCAFCAFPAFLRTLSKCSRYIVNILASV